MQVDLTMDVSVDTYVINLEHSTERMQEFRRNNAHMPEIKRFSAVDGSTIDRRGLVAANVISGDLPYTNGALGCALSHISFWRAATAENAAITVCEDDAIFHGSFPDLAPRLIASVPSDWDLIMWGWNFDSILLFDLMPGVSPCIAAFDQDQLRRAASAYQKQALFPRLFRLIQSFGLICYTVSPVGAKKLLERCLPIRPMTIAVPRITASLPNYGIDIVMSTTYPGLKAYVSFPPLVVTRNEHGSSTVQPQR